MNRFWHNTQKHGKIAKTTMEKTHRRSSSGDILLEKSIMPSPLKPSPTFDENESKIGEETRIESETKVVPMKPPLDFRLLQG